MDRVTLRQRPPAGTEAADRRELLERLERVQRRLQALAEAGRASEAELRRQRAAARRP